MSKFSNYADCKVSKNNKLVEKKYPGRGVYIKMY